MVLLGPIECLPIASVAELGLTHLEIVLLDSGIVEEEVCRYLVLVSVQLGGFFLPFNWVSPRLPVGVWLIELLLL